MALCGVKTSTLLEVDQKHLESSETWCWRRIEFSWSYRVRNEEVRVLDRVSRKKKSSYKAREIPLQAWTGPEGSRRLRLSEFKTIGI
jgi:hypothetical protein